MTDSSQPPASLSLPLNPTDHVIGPAHAAVVIIEYGDFECPSCAQAFPAVKLLLKEFENKIRFAFRHFPIEEAHPHAKLAAEAAEAAGAQGKFWQMHDLLFENQSHLKLSALHQYAAQLELDLTRFDADIADHIYLQRVQEHIDSAQDSEVRASPTFFVNGKVVDVSFGIQHLFDAVRMRVK